VTWKYTPHAPDSTQSGKTQLDDGGDMNPRVHIGVDVKEGKEGDQDGKIKL